MTKSRKPTDWSRFSTAQVFILWATNAVVAAFYGYVVGSTLPSYAEALNAVSGPADFGVLGLAVTAILAVLATGAVASGFVSEKARTVLLERM